MIDEKSVFEVSYALAGKVALDSLEDKVPYVPLSDIEPEPESYDEAMKSKYKNAWVQAMTAELAGLKNTNTFQPAVKPDGRKSLSAKWVFKWKTDQAGCVVKAKARLVAKGFSQIEGVDYLDTFAPPQQRRHYDCLQLSRVRTTLTCTTSMPSKLFCNLRWTKR